MLKRTDCSDLVQLEEEMRMLCRSVWKLDMTCLVSTVSARHFCLNQLLRHMILFHFISCLTGLCFMFAGK